jgi:hypothetical protein
VNIFSLQNTWLSSSYIVFHNVKCKSALSNNTRFKILGAAHFALFCSLFELNANTFNISSQLLSNKHGKFTSDASF